MEMIMRQGTVPLSHDRKDPGRYGNLRTRGGLLYYHYDALGSVGDLTDHLGENTVKYRWDAFGGMFAGTLAPYSFKGITGKDHDPKSGLMFYNSRWYDPQVGRFTQPDSFKGIQTQPGTQHPYAYVGNNPINRLDPTGHDFLGHDVDGIEYGTDYYGDQTGSWNNFGEFVSGGSNDSGSGGGGGWTPGGIVPGDFDSGGGEYIGDGGYYGGSGGGSSSGGVGESRPPTLEERNQVYSQASQPVSTMYKLQANTLKQIVSYIKSMPGKPGLSNYGWNQDQVQKFADAVAIRAMGVQVAYASTGYQNTDLKSWQKPSSAADLFQQDLQEKGYMSVAYNLESSPEMREKISNAPKILDPDYQIENDADIIEAYKNDLKRIFPNNPSIVPKSILKSTATGAVTGVRMYGPSGAILGTVGGSAGAIQGYIRYRIGVYLWEEGGFPE